MILVKNSSGEWEQVAGNGKAEYGASTVRSGTITTDEIDIGSFAVFTVTFDTPMPDDDYRITYCWNTAGGNITFAIVTITEKTANGFKLYVRNSDVTANPLTSHILSWYAFKLYTDTEYNKVLDTANNLVFEDISSKCTFNNLGDPMSSGKINTPKVFLSKKNKEIKIVFNSCYPLNRGETAHHISIPFSVIGEKVVSHEDVVFCSRSGTPWGMARIWSTVDDNYLYFQATGQILGSAMEDTCTLRGEKTWTYWTATT